MRKIIYTQTYKNGKSGQWGRDAEHKSYYPYDIGDTVYIVSDSARAIVYQSNMRENKEMANRLGCKRMHCAYYSRERADLPVTIFNLEVNPDDDGVPVLPFSKDHKKRGYIDPILPVVYAVRYEDGFETMVHGYSLTDNNPNSYEIKEEYRNSNGSSSMEQIINEMERENPRYEYRYHFRLY